MLCITFHTSWQSNVNYAYCKLTYCLFCALSPPFPRYPKGQGSHLKHPSPQQHGAATSERRRAPASQQAAVLEERVGQGEYCLAYLG